MWKINILLTLLAVVTCVAGSLQYAHITYYGKDSECAGNQGITQIQFAGACFNLFNNFRYILCEGATVTTYSDCNSDCSSCSTSHSVSQNICVNGTYVVECSLTKPSYTSDRLVEVFYANQCSEYSAWTIFPNECQSISNSSMFYGCKGGQGYTTICEDKNCQQNCISSNMNMMQCTDYLQLGYQCGM